ncbi:hypothetical protein GCQ56_08910 [Marinifilum sp. N1E240]|uniref:uroporphyrinogen-III synthase n=1 Tax=Marinifilum sp. N1E240 TaxID=2608082 RepID=UPI00128B5228|nr:uroporphyrinogen-III synthase [Marinifilum sp. N1E240]MPQ47136.1 hypothetical protein [Marinifilum sp. N1E240]
MYSTDSNRILFTRNLSDGHYDFGNKIGLQLSDHAFIDIKINTLGQREIELLESESKAEWIFTSRNAVKSLAPILSKLVLDENHKVYAVGKKTAEELSKIGLQAIVPSTHNARALVELLEKNKAESYIYFSGNIRKNTIVNFFTENDLTYEEIECYKTSLIQPEIDVDNFDAICFCSPSAIVSFFKKYKLKSPVPCIAIGNSSAVKLLDYTEHVVMSEKANIYSMLEICNEYLNS